MTYICGVYWRGEWIGWVDRPDMECIDVPDAITNPGSWLALRCIPIYTTIGKDHPRVILAEE